MNLSGKYYYAKLSILCMALVWFSSCKNTLSEVKAEAEEPADLVYPSYKTPCEWPELLTLTDCKGLIVKHAYQTGVFEITNLDVLIPTGELWPCSLPESFMKDSIHVIFSGKVKYIKDYVTKDGRTIGDNDALPVELTDIRVY